MCRGRRRALSAAGRSNGTQHWSRMAGSTWSSRRCASDSRSPEKVPLHKLRHLDVSDKWPSTLGASVVVPLNVPELVAAERQDTRCEGYVGPQAGYDPAGLARGRLHGQVYRSCRRISLRQVPLLELNLQTIRELPLRVGDAMLKFCALLPLVRAAPVGFSRLPESRRSQIWSQPATPPDQALKFALAQRPFLKHAVPACTLHNRRRSGAHQIFLRLSVLNLHCCSHGWLAGAMALRTFFMFFIL